MHVADVCICSFAYCCHLSLEEDAFYGSLVYRTRHETLSVRIVVYVLLYVPATLCMGLQYRISVLRKRYIE
jgi:hypothetical protein